MSSLAQQLEKLRRGSTAPAKGVGAHASFMYNAKDAEHIDSDTIAHLAANGLAELRQLCRHGTHSRRGSTTGELSRDWADVL